MAAYGIKTSVYLVPSPGSQDYSTQIKDLTQKTQVFDIEIKGGINTLHLSNTCRGDDVSGFAYVPTLAQGNPCFVDYVPENATTLHDLPHLGFDVVAFAPWVDQNCSIQFLQSAADDAGFTKAFIFYDLQDGKPVQTLPNESNPMWDINYSHYHFPVYAINGVIGEVLMNKIAELSGNITSVWESPALAQEYDNTSVARVFLRVDTGSPSPIPGLWIFLLVVLAVLIFVIGATSLVMHWLQFRHRVALRQRVANGEIDLEAMGIKRLTIPKTVLDQFPLRPYEPTATPIPSPALVPIILQSLSSGSSEAKLSRPSSSQSIAIRTSSTPSAESPPSRYRPPSPPLPPSPVITRAPSLRSAASPGHAYSQTNCSVCLENFEPGVTVRELPCLHIYHPECIDPYLTNNSSLCPYCKTSALPKGYVPPNLTNATVRRARLLRRMRERAIRNTPEAVPSPHWWAMFTSAAAIRHFLRVCMHGSSTVGAGIPAHVEMAGYSGTRRRTSFSAMAAPTQEEEDEEWRRMSRWKRFLKRAFPR